MLLETRLFLWLLLIPFLFLHTQGEQIQSIRIETKARDRYCNSCQKYQNTSYYPYSVCTDTPSWNKTSQNGLPGHFLFQDPIPTFSALEQVSLTVYGSFSCDEKANAAFLLQEEYIDWLPLPNTSAACSCSNCITQSITAYSPVFEFGWPDYNYGGMNDLAVIVTSEVYFCISYMILNMTYKAPVPWINTIYPSSSEHQGGTVVNIRGESLFNTTGFSCYFGENAVHAYHISEDEAICKAPPNHNTSLLYETSLSVYLGIGTKKSNEVAFFYFASPIVSRLEPNHGFIHEESEIWVIGKNFQALADSGEYILYPQCYFGGEPSPNSTFVNSTHFRCVTPLMNYTGNVIFQVSLNGAQKTTFSADFAFIVHTDTNQSLPFYVWIIVAGTVIVLVAALVVWQAFKGRQGKQRVLPERNSLLNSSYSGLGSTDDASQWAAFDKYVKRLDLSEISVGQRIGKGSFGEVFVGDWQGTKIALKKLPAHKLTEEFLQEFAREAQIMRSLRHPNILQFLGACTDPPDICIIMEFMPRGSLYNIIHDKSIPLPWDLIKRMAIDAAKGMAYLHTSTPKIIHRDLKSHNLLVDENWKVKVSDFGLSRIYGDTQATMTACGTPCWTAPEILRNAKYTEKADIYSFGIVLWEMASREDPFAGMPPFQVIFAVGTQGARPKIPSYCPTEYSQLIQECWQEDPSKRKSFNEILKRLNSIQL